MRHSGRSRDELRTIQFERRYTKHAEGSVLVSYGDTRVLCTVSWVPGVPRFLKNTQQGWLTAEYGMLPRSTTERMPRESSKGGPSGRSQEIQRLIGRSLRSLIDFKQLGENTLMIDCDVLQADGGTRTASISGACVALHDAIGTLLRETRLKQNPLKGLIAAVSVGLLNDLPILDLDYREDSTAATDLNVVMNERGEFIEVQGTAEQKAFSFSQLQGMLHLAQNGIRSILEMQRQALERTV